MLYLWCCQQFIPSVQKWFRQGAENPGIFNKKDEAFPCPRRLAFSDIANLAL